MILCRISAEAVCWLLSLILRPLEEMPDTDASPVSLDTAVDLLWYDLGNIGGAFLDVVEMGGRAPTELSLFVRHDYDDFGGVQVGNGRVTPGRGWAFVPTTSVRITC